MLRKARMRDVPAIQKLVNDYAAQELMLPVSLVTLYDRLRDFRVCEEDGQVVGAGALHISWENLAEVRSLAVAASHQKRGIAREIVRELLDEARAFECARVFTLTFVPGFFEKLGFRRIDKSELPHKIWADCINCPKFPDCDEVAMALDLAPEAGRAGGG